MDEEEVVEKEKDDAIVDMEKLKHSIKKQLNLHKGQI